MEKSPADVAPEEKSFFGIIVHSFFIIPFLIVVFGILLFTTVNLLTKERVSVYDYLEQVRVGGLSTRWQAAFNIFRVVEDPKRWQGALDLSRVLANPKLIPGDERFVTEMISAFEATKNDDPRVRLYLALAMGRTGNAAFVPVLIKALDEEKDNNLYAVIYALGMLRDKNAVPALTKFLNSPEGRIRSTAVVALGNIADAGIKPLLIPMLEDTEPNVRWGAAISLARLSDDSGRKVLIQLLDREYLSKFPEIDQGEQTQLILAAIDAVRHIRDPQIDEKLRRLAVEDKNLKVRAAAWDLKGTEGEGQKS